MLKVSIITPCYNAEPYIARTVASVQAQTLTEWEHIVVDDGSTDGSAATVEMLATREPRLKLIRQENGGVGRARNRGAAACSPDSEYLLFLDADDCLEPHMLQTLTDALHAHPEAGMAYGSLSAIDADDRPLPPGPDADLWPTRFRPGRLGPLRLPPDEPQTPFLSIFVLTALIPSAALLRRAVYAATGGWDEAFGQPAEDTDLFLRMALRAPVRFLPEALLRYRIHSTQSTRGFQKMRAQEAKLYDHWGGPERLSGLTPAQRDMVRAARRFRARQFAPYVGARQGMTLWRGGERVTALRFWAGAARLWLTARMQPS